MFNLNKENFQITYKESNSNLVIHGNYKNAPTKIKVTLKKEEDLYTIKDIHLGVQFKGDLNKYNKFIKNRHYLEPIKVKESGNIYEIERTMEKLFKTYIEIYS